MQPPSPGQQSLGAGTANDSLPVHEHRSIDTPTVPNSISVRTIVDVDMKIALFISRY